MGWKLCALALACIQIVPWLAAADQSELLTVGSAKVVASGEHTFAISFLSGLFMLFAR